MKYIFYESAPIFAVLAVLAASCGVPDNDADVLKDAARIAPAEQSIEKDAPIETREAFRGSDIEAPDTEDADARPRRRARMDADGDGRVTYEEAVAVFPDLTREEFKAHDTDDDGAWDLEEARSFREERRGMFEGRGLRDGRDRMGEGRGPRDGRGRGDGRGPGGGRGTAREPLPRP